MTLAVKVALNPNTTNVIQNINFVHQIVENVVCNEENVGYQEFVFKRPLFLD